MNRPYSPLAFSNEFVAKSGASGIVHMKLQKLVYLCYGWWLVAHDDPIIDEAPQVWKHGPVFASLYDILKSHGHNRITHLQKRFFTERPERVDDDDLEAHDLIDWVWERYGPYDQFYLSDLTHKKGSPWYITAEQYGFRVPFNTEISDDLIQRHYREIATERGFYEG